MAKASKPLNLISSHLTKEERQKREQAEELLKGSNDKVYEVPGHLSTQEQELYQNLVNEMKESDILCNLDTELLCITVNAISKMRQADKLIDQVGLLVPRADGTLTKNPACQIYKDYQAIFYQCMLQLGLSPSSRAKMATVNIKAEQEKNDPLLAILNG